MKTKASITINHGRGLKEIIEREVFLASTSGVFCALDEHSDVHKNFNTAGCEWFPFQSEKVSVKLI